MATPTEHALLSASSSGRWLNCTAAPRYEAEFGEDDKTVYAAEGTLAHRICELSAQYNFNIITKRKLNSQIKKLRENELFQEEMITTGVFYAEYLRNKSLTFANKPYTTWEVKVDFSDYVPEGFGTCDCVMIGDDTLHITDYKHGKGVEVSAKNNSQMRLYALGALKQYASIFGSAIKKVSMAIVQPRITEDVSEEVLTVEELLQWGENIKPIALKAYSGFGEFKCGTWCRFCKGKAVCKARTENNTALEDFKGFVIEGKLTEEEKQSESFPNRLTDNEVAEMLIRGADLVAWYNDLQDYALNAILDGKAINGFKVVEGRSNRAFSDTDKAIEAFKGAGYEEKDLYKPKEPLTLSALEKLAGKKKFAELVGSLVIKPQGKPTLVPELDKREPYHPAAVDFKGVGNDG